MLRQSQGSGERLVTGGLGCEDDGGGVDMEGVGVGLGRAMVSRILEGEQWVYRVGRERNSQKACT